MIEKTVCELFAGVGGFRLGLEKSSPDWSTVWSNQWEPGKKIQYAFQCYESHFGTSSSHVNEDISIINKSTIIDHNLLVGGFPCQDYSVARTGAKGIKGVKGVLWWEIRDILEAKAPRFVLLENVDRLLKSPSKQRGRDFGIILKCFDDLNYDVEWRIINAAEYGFTQRRRRVFIFAYKRSTSHAKNIESNSNTDIVMNTGFFAQTFPLTQIESGREMSFNSFDDVFDVSENFKFEFSNSGFMRSGNIFVANSRPQQYMPVALRTLLQQDVAERYYLNGNIEKWYYLKGSKRLSRVSKGGHEYVFSEGGMGFPDSLDKPARTMLTSESSLNRSTHVLEDPQTNRLRLITPVEAERINCFPDGWTDTGMPEKFRYFCMGNALVVALIEKMGHTLNFIFSNEAE